MIRVKLMPDVRSARSARGDLECYNISPRSLSCMPQEFLKATCCLDDAEHHICVELMNNGRVFLLGTLLGMAEKLIRVTSLK